MEGPLEKGTILNNGFYEIEVKELRLGRPHTERTKLPGHLHLGWTVELEIKNIGDDRGVASHISQANFRLRMNGKTFLYNKYWIAHMFLGDSIDYKMSTSLDSRDYLHQFETGYLFLNDSITFQAITKTILFEGMAIPSGSRLGAPIVFNVVAPKDD